LTFGKYMRALTTIIACVLLCGCVSQPTTPLERADAAAAMGMILMASAAQEKGSAASALWQARIPLSAFDVLSSIQAYLRTFGVWPKREEIALPDGVTELLLHGTDEDLAVVMKKEEAVLMRCKILKDGTVVVAPLFEDFMSALTSRSGTSVPVFPVVLPPKK
jgi:hypothetical protein